MKKALVPMVASLAMCGAATAMLAADNASAETPRRPMMVAMVSSRALLPMITAAPAPDGGALDRRSDPAQMARRHKHMCQDAYAQQVGELAYLGVRLNLTAAQQPLFERWKNAKLGIAKRSEADCTTREIPTRDSKTRPTPITGMAREEDTLKRRLADIQAERPVLAALYNALDAAQKEALMRRDSGPTLGGGGLFDGADRRGPGPMRPLGNQPSRGVGASPPPQ